MSTLYKYGKLLIYTESIPNSRRLNIRRIETVRGDMKLLDTWISKSVVIHRPRKVDMLLLFMQLSDT
jgi:hypothetical protein